MKNYLKGPLTMYRNASPHMMRRARLLRENETEAEKVFWQWVKGGKILGYKFRRQHALAFYVADFYCHSLQLVVEIDGDIHEQEERKVMDTERQRTIEFMGIRVIRFTNDEVMHQQAMVLEKLEKVINEIRSVG